jgi:hypothetical protein
LQTVRDTNLDIVSGAEPEGTLKKYQTLMNQLEAFCDDKGIRFVQELGQDEVLEFRRSWEDPEARYKRTRLKKNGKPLWTTKSIGTAKRDGRTLIYFFDRCIVRKWITENPAIILTFPKGKKGTAKTDNKHLLSAKFDEIVEAASSRTRRSRGTLDTQFQSKGYIVGTDVNVPNGLNRNPNPAIPPLLWNRTMPRFPAISGN